ncbi:MAG: hypothetical protein IT462_04795 [Planctomycetes bacterium]|nr:hypothetical protein [Planctomycetota bacterium]
MKRTATLLVAILLAFITVACDGGGGGGGGGVINPTRILVVTRVTAISDDGTDSVGSISTLSAAPTLTYTITNGGTQPLTLSGSTPWVTVGSQVNVSGLVVTQPPSNTVAPSGMVTFDVDYTVSGSGVFSFAIVFGTDATSGQTGPTFTIFVDGTGDNSTRILAVSRSGAISDGGTDAVGSVPTGNAPTLTYTLTNTGTGAMTLTGASPWVNVLPLPAPVNITGTPVVTQPASSTVSAGGGSITFDVDYVVAGTGVFSFTLVFGTDASSGQTGPTFEINVSGTGVAPTRVIAVSGTGAIADGATDAQGNVNATVAAPTLTYTITNNGNSDLTLTGSTPWVTVAAAPAPVNISGSPVITQPSGAVIAASGNVTFDVDYTVAGAGAFSFTVTFGSDATSGQTGGTFEVVISGTGVVANRVIQVKRSLITLADAGTDSLGRRPYGVSGGFVEYQINNTGTDPLTISGGPNFVTTSTTVNLTGVITITQPSSGTINGGASDTFRIDFTVAATGAFSFVVSMTTDATGGQTGPTFTFTVSGTGGVELLFAALEAAPTPPPTPYEPYANMAASGATRSRLITGGMSPMVLQSAPVASPNGAYVAFEAQQSLTTPYVRHVYVVPIGGGAIVQVDPNPLTADDRYSFEPTWAPTTGANQYLMFRSDMTSPAQSGYEIFTAQISGVTPVVSNLTKIGGWGTATSSFRIKYGFKWRSDAAGLAFIVQDNGAAMDQIWACAFASGVPGTVGRVDGTGGSWVNTDTTFEQFAWAGTGAIIMYVDDPAVTQFRLWACSVTLGATPSGGTRILQCDNIGASDYVPQSPQGWAVSTDGTRVTWIRSGTGIDHVHIAVVSTSSAPASLQVDAIPGIIANADANGLAISPTGDSVSFVIDALVDGQQDMYTQMFTTSSGAVTLSGNSINISVVATNEGVGSLFYYSPEGGRLLYRVFNGVTSTQRVEVGRIAASPSRTNVTAGLTNAAATMNQLAWRPGDGAAVIYMADGETAGDTEGYCVPLYGANGITMGTRFRFTGTIFSTYGANNCSWIP